MADDIRTRMIEDMKSLGKSMDDAIRQGMRKEIEKLPMDKYKIQADETIEAYHASFDADSNSSLKLYRENLAAYAAIRIFKTMQQAPPTEAMKFGQAFDCACFENHDMPNRFAVAPLVDRRTKAGKEMHAAHLKASNGKTSISMEDSATITLMISSINHEEWASNAIFHVPGITQKSFRWTDEETGLALKCRPDRILETGVVVDLKSSCDDVSPASFSWTIKKYGYHRQAALYMDGLRANGIEAEDFVFVAVRKVWPFDVCVMRLEEDSIKLGREDNRQTLIELAERKKTNNWRHEWAGKINMVGVRKQWTTNTQFS